MSHHSESEIHELIEIKKTIHSDKESVDTHRKRLKAQVLDTNSDIAEKLLDKSFESQSYNSLPIKENKSNVILSSK